ncbi:hypothetical protein BpOF4_04495 [Alkalihalophilus pseudofirmus OF4]|uniref:Uncharacterized protein n=1 Tax=Alkalihalophilus pseudofirmus (strain ATCC BAA-2126 / JCM 17055 / OF4) TaxID=398511 RepID=D3FYT0_ALKPO|nr:hypothetical protein [Alkalihalophilus pseudofirmus]ADC48963.1 hypothetical protein BpOF4_04495 [Alkalihalophilus pseudofirmus OF4]
MNEQKQLPNDKKELLEGRNYEMYNLDVIRKVFPRIIAEIQANHGRNQRKFQSRDLIALYFYLLSYVDGNYLRKDGTQNERFGAAFPSVARIKSALGIDEKRIPKLVGILVANGLISETRDHWDGTRRAKWYFVSFCPRITDDGYLVSENGEIIEPNFSDYGV